MLDLPAGGRYATASTCANPTLEGALIGLGVAAVLGLVALVAHVASRPRPSTPAGTVAPPLPPDRPARTPAEEAAAEQRLLARADAGVPR